MRKIIVVGAGISGLSAAHRLMELAKQKNLELEVQVLEASSRIGGAIATRRKDDYLWEEGPDSFLTEKPWAVDLCKRLGLESELIGTNPAYKKCFVLKKGKLYPIPEGFYLLAPSDLKAFFHSPIFSWPGKMRMALEMIMPCHKMKTDESLASFVRRRFGKEALDRIVQPLASGIYSTDPEFLSLRAAFPKFVEMEEKHGSLIRALVSHRKNRDKIVYTTDDSIDAEGVSGARYNLFVSLKKGMYSLIEALVQKLPSESIHLDSNVQSIKRVEGRYWVVSLASGHELKADGLCLAVPAPKAGPLLRPLDSALADTLASIPYDSSATLHLAYDRMSIDHALDGFGFVVPAIENKPFSACSFSSIKFSNRAPKTQALFRVFIPSSQLNQTDPQLEKRIRGDLYQLLDIKGDSLWGSLKRYQASMPQYKVGHLDKVQTIEWRSKVIPRLVLAGNAYRGIGIPDCVHSGEKAAESLIEQMGSYWGY